MKLHKLLIVHIISLLAILPLNAQLKTEELGNIWVITIDKSGSMKDGITQSTFNKECDNLLKVLDGFKLNKLIDFEKDKFCIFHTGLYNQYSNNSPTPQKTHISEVLKSNKSFTELFIHHNAKQLRTIENYAQLKKIISDDLKLPFRYRWSFVSQIRVTALEKTLNYLSQHNLNNSYQNIYILTITDDADANDQWKNDYRVIKSIQKNGKRIRLEELNELQEKLIYNPLTGHGNGELEEICENDKNRIHAYLYKYSSKQQLRDHSELIAAIRSEITIKHVEEKSIRITLNQKNFSGDSVVFWQIDTIAINNQNIQKHRPQKYSSNDIDIQLSDAISNIKFNQVDIIGKVQVSYQDSILGAHYKDIPFVINDKFIASQAQYTSFVWTILLLVFALVSYLVYYFVILPKQVVFSMYLPNNNKVSIRHGHILSYPSQVPLLLVTKHHNLVDYVVNNNSNITVSKVNDLNITDNKIIVLSKAPLNLENPVFIADVYERYIDCSSEMADALKYDYAHTIQSYLVHQYNQQNSQLSQLTHWLFNIANSLYPKYYYEINISNIPSQYTIESPLRSRTLFLLDFQNPSTHHDRITENILKTYYSDRKYGKADIIIAAHHNAEDKTSIDICLIEQKNNGVPCIANVNHIYHYTSNNKIPNEELNGIIKDLKKEIHKTFGIKKIVILEKINTSNNSYNLQNFSISQPTYNKFILFIEANDKQKSQLVYSPFVPYSKFVSLHPSKYSGHLYEAITPSALHNKAQSRMLSNEIVRINSGTIQRLEFQGPKNNPTSIILGTNQINIEIKNI